MVHVESVGLVSCDFQGNSHSAVIDAKACVELNSKGNSTAVGIDSRPVC